MIKRIFVAILAFVIGFGIAQAMVPTADQINSASPVIHKAVEVVAPEEASARVGYVRVQNLGVPTFKIYCDFDSSHYETLSNGQNSQQSGKCTDEHYDTDQILTTTTVCVKFTGPVKADGYYRLSPGTRRKIPDLSTFAVWPLSKCSGRGSAYKGYWTYTR